MKAQKILGLICLLVLAAPMLASAEIYKWKDKNGVMRYSDKQPEANVKVDTLRGGGVVSKTSTAQPKGDGNQEPLSKELSKRIADPESSDAEAARLRARNAAAEKRNEAEKKKMAKLNAENCKAAKANYATFKQGGRIYKTNANGDREYYGDAELKTQASKAQAEIRKFCK